MPTDVNAPRLHRPDGRIAGAGPIPDLPGVAFTHRPAAAWPGRAHPEPTAHHPPLGSRQAGDGPIPELSRCLATHHPVAAEPGPGPLRRDRAPQPPTGLRPGADPGLSTSSPGARLRGPPPHTSVAVEGRESRVAEGHRAATRPQGAPLTPGPEPPSSSTGRPPHPNELAPGHEWMPPTAHGPRPTAHGPRPTAHGPRPTAHGPRPPSPSPAPLSAGPGRTGGRPGPHRFARDGRPRRRRAASRPGRVPDSARGRGPGRRRPGGTAEDGPGPATAVAGGRPPAGRRARAPSRCAASPSPHRPPTYRPADSRSRRAPTSRTRQGPADRDSQAPRIAARRSWPGRYTPPRSQPSTPHQPSSTRRRHAPGVPHASRSGRALRSHSERSSSSV